MDFRVETATREGTYVIALFGELDMAAADVFPCWTASMNGHRSVEVDLRGLTFMDSSGLHKLIDLQHQLSSENRTLRVRCLPESPARRLFELTGLTDRFTLID